MTGSIAAVSRRGGGDADVTIATPTMVTTMPTSTIAAGRWPRTISSKTVITGERNPHVITRVALSLRSAPK